MRRSCVALILALLSWVLSSEKRDRPCSDRLRAPSTNRADSRRASAAVGERDSHLDDLHVAMRSTVVVDRALLAGVPAQKKQVELV